MNNEFDMHWSSRSYKKIASQKFGVSERFLKPVIDRLGQCEEHFLKILDAGCGDGVHATTMSKYNSNYEYIGVDISQIAISICSELIKDCRFCFETGDISCLKYDDDEFDIVFSYGVVAYTAAPGATMKELARVMKNDGILGVWCYPKRSSLSGWLFNAVRMICKAGGPTLTKIVANSIVPFLYFLPLASGINLVNSCWAQCCEVVLVNISPQYLVFPTRDMLLDWICSANLRVIAEENKFPHTFWCASKFSDNLSS